MDCGPAMAQVRSPSEMGLDKKKRATPSGLTMGPLVLAWANKGGDVEMNVSL